MDFEKTVQEDMKVTTIAISAQGCTQNECVQMFEKIMKCR